MSCKSVVGEHGSSSSSALHLAHVAVAMGAITIAAAANPYWFQARHKSQPRMVGIIPARFKSPRFVSESLVDILDIAMIQRTWEQAKQFASIKVVVVASDNHKIADFFHVVGANVMTAGNCLSGIEPCNEVLEKLDAEYDIVLNVHGDEPLIKFSSIDELVISLLKFPQVMFYTANTVLGPNDASNCNWRNDIVDRKDFALYFSPAHLPPNKAESINPDFPCMRHHDMQLEEDLEPTLISSLK